jgi:hypothetical protein
VGALRSLPAATVAGGSRPALPRRGTSIHVARYLGRVLDVHFR